MFIVVYDDSAGICYHYTWDENCDGALRSSNEGEPAALFQTRKDARKAIEISKAFMRLQKLRDEPANDDFDAKYLKCIRIIPLKPKPGA